MNRKQRKDHKRRKKEAAKSRAEAKKDAPVVEEVVQPEVVETTGSYGKVMTLLIIVIVLGMLIIGMLVKRGIGVLKEEGAPVTSVNTTNTLENINHAWRSFTWAERRGDREKADGELTLVHDYCSRLTVEGYSTASLRLALDLLQDTWDGENDLEYSAVWKDVNKSIKRL
jgi:hypothetical protein